MRRRPGATTFEKMQVPCRAPSPLQSGTPPVCLRACLQALSWWMMNVQKILITGIGWVGEKAQV